jgi:tetratricopeptide (TPR) repeat protein
MNKFEEAEMTFTDALDIFEDSDELHFSLSVLYEETKRFDDMVRHLKETIRINPEHADALNFLGYSYAEKGIKLEEARTLITRALEIKPNNGYITDSLGWVYFKMGRYEKAIETLEKAVGFLKDDPILYEHLGDAYHAKSKKLKAVEAWKRAIEYHEKEEGLKERIEKKIKGITKP